MASPSVALHVPSNSLKRNIGRRLFSLLNIQRVHIVGCSRSGTTLLHLAMACFRDTTVSEIETGVQYPHLRERLKVALRECHRVGKKFYVTKRDYDWFESTNIDELIRVVQEEQIGLIHIVRDPRDVMQSRLIDSARDRAGLAYVSPQHWYDSILAADRVFEGLAHYPKKLVLRYEDLVLNSEFVEAQLTKIFGFVRDSKALPIDRVKDNFALLHVRFDPERLRKTGGLRNMDAKSVGKWRGENYAKIEDQLNGQIRRRFDSFCADHGYA